MIIDEFTKRLNQYNENLKLEINEIIISEDVVEKAIEKQMELNMLQKMI